jgi:Raf kinase inhibitor-like YbhB/YbcL family protein
MIARRGRAQGCRLVFVGAGPKSGPVTDRTWIMRSTALAALVLAAAIDTATAADFTLTSPGLPEGATVPQAMILSGFGCTGGNVSPELHWSGAPAGTKSFAVTLYDPDAPTGSGFWHWVAFDIPADVDGLKAGAGDPDKKLAPAGMAMGRNDFGAAGYGGPCPPMGSGVHHYEIVVHALRVGKLPEGAGTTAALTGFMLNGAELGRAKLTLTLER